MKHNAFGGMKIQPGDDLAVCWSDEFGTEDDPQLTAYALADDNAAGMGWTASIEDQDGNEAELHDFASEEALREYLTSWKVEIDEERG